MLMAAVLGRVGAGYGSRCDAQRIPAFGAMSDALAPTYRADSLRYALCTGAAFYVLAAVLFLFASRTIKKDWVE